MSVVLSKRLKALADMVTPGMRVVDVGCDHGFLSVYLVQNKISPKALAMDVRTGPLARAKEHVAEYKLEDYIETRLSDGLLQYRKGEADAMICAGMGGRVMTKILTESADKAKGLKELILQPQSEIPEFRRFLRSEGYIVLDENILCEDGKFYFLFKVCNGAKDAEDSGVKNAAESSTDGADGKKMAGTLAENALYEEFGELLLKGRHPVLRDYLLYRVETAKQIKEALAGNEKDRTRERLEEVEKELLMLRKALGFFEA